MKTEKSMFVWEEGPFYGKMHRKLLEHFMLSNGILYRFDREFGLFSSRYTYYVEGQPKDLSRLFNAIHDYNERVQTALRHSEEN
jgi:hypothetical protein